MEEEDIYLATKYFLLQRGWKPLGGDPPQGTDLPRLEIKKPGEVQSLRKNQDSVINDLVFARDGLVLLIENKPGYDRGDVEKLDGLAGSRPWRLSILESLEERNLLEKNDFTREDIVSGRSLVKTLAFEGDPREGLDDFVQICWSEEGEEPSVNIGDEVQILTRL